MDDVDGDLAAALLHGVDRVLDEVREDLDDLIAVRPDARERTWPFVRDADLLAGRGALELDDVADDLVDVDLLRARGGEAREARELGDDVAMRWTSSRTVRVASSKYSSKAGSLRARRRRSVSTAARIGASGFFTSWATRRATSRHAATRLAAARRRRVAPRSSSIRSNACASSAISPEPRTPSGRA